MMRKKDLKKIKKQTRGMTLIELVLYVAVSSVILVGVVYFVQAMLETSVKHDVVQAVNNEGSRLLAQIVDEVQNAESIILPQENQDGTILELLTADGNVRFYLENELVFFERNNIEYELTGNRNIVTALVFEHLSPSVVRIQFTLTYNSSSDRDVYQYSQEFISSAEVRKI